MTETRLDVLAIGNAIVDVIADCDDAFLAAEGLTKGMMRLIDADEAARLTSIWPARQIRAAPPATRRRRRGFGRKGRLHGQVATNSRRIYRHDLTATGVEFTTTVRISASRPRARWFGDDPTRIGR